MLKKLAKFFGSFPEEGFVSPFFVNTTNQEILVDVDKGIKGDREKYKQWMKETIVRGVPEERMIFYNFLKLWELEEIIQELLEFKDELIKRKASQALEPTGFVEKTIDIPAEDITVEVEPALAATLGAAPPKPRIVPVETEDGILYYEIMEDGKLRLVTE